MQLYIYIYINIYKCSLLYLINIRGIHEFNRKAFKIIGYLLQLALGQGLQLCWLVELLHHIAHQTLVDFVRPPEGGFACLGEIYSQLG